MIEKMVKKLV